MGKHSWQAPVHKAADLQMLRDGFVFVESRYEGEIAVSKYRGPQGHVVRVSEYGDKRFGEFSGRPSTVRPKEQEPESEMERRTR
jgi:hypothetical protein